MMFDIAAGRRQKMWIMDFVWPLTGLYSGPLGLWAYFQNGRQSTKQPHENRNRSPALKPFWQQAAVTTTHCGAGCTLGDLCAESLMAAAPLTLFGHRIFGSWVVDFVFAYVLGIAFQYYTIAPMRHLSPGAGLRAAIKADTLSLVAWQVGMYGWMALVPSSRITNERADWCREPLVLKMLA
ncbi:MAG TPA: DUF4396 domain-containing protein [Pirellulales bacterium]|jgi:hypothetical protein|nr:DUF4396 domain-containing protein [Pirellulales bacterium]